MGSVESLIADTTGDDYIAFRESLRGEFNKRFDEQSSFLRSTLPSDAYNAQRALCFGWYINGYLCGAGSGIEVEAASETAALESA
jgi:hypothetical protein